MLQHLNGENDYTKAVMADTEALQVGLPVGLCCDALALG